MRISKHNPMSFLSAAGIFFRTNILRICGANFVIDFFPFKQEYQPRGDYKYFLNVTNIFIGGVLMFIFGSQCPQVKPERKMKLKYLCAFKVNVYVHYWFTTPVAVMSPFNDLIFLKSQCH